MTNIRSRVLYVADVVMRVPPLFIIDELLRVGLGLPTENLVLNETDNGFVNVPDSLVGSLVGVTTEANLLHQYESNQQFYQLYLITALKFILCCLGCAAALCTFMLQTKHLVLVYLYLISVGVIFVSYWSNVSTVKAIISCTSVNGTTTSILDDVLNLDLNKVLDFDGPGFLVIQNYMLQCTLALIFCYIHLAPRYSIIQKLLVFSLMAPSILAALPLPVRILHHAPVFATLLPLAVSKFVLWYNAVSMGQIIYSGYQHARTFISSYGLSALVEAEWTRLNVPRVLRTFWTLRVTEQILQILGNHYEDESFNYYIMIRTLLINGCETLTAVLGMTSIISSICHYIGCFFQWILLTEDKEDLKSIGTTSAILFYTLCLQTGLTSLQREMRLNRLCRNFCLLFTALLHFVHNIVNPLLMSLSASRNPALHRHLRALLVCAFLIIFPIHLLCFLWSHFPISTWLLAVTAFSVEVIVKVLVSLAIYSLFLYDACRRSFWEQLDDYVYYIRVFGNTVEFAFGLFLLFNGLWILIFESGGAIRAVMMCIHAYFNIWCEAKAGWSVFMKRRTAVNKINSLPEAKTEQLTNLDDVCAICYQEMNSAKITRCNHFFHGVCLRKWLYVQDRCPLCHDILYRVDSPHDSTDNISAITDQEGRNR
ncbi:protein TRC8 homolog [Athalia rosae]|uniref:protein TRC8 homolog n=1 Tax=Athalia rosae TaxID=37344 RepID=UPI002033A525|nr:protein TRC8 homolog [Athalia rosae]XP_048506066.1 protein TRC8 homolog [Athalia rosae]XP_048506067.1 protein TRC8 homolog [Athalia rosae]